MSLAQHLQHASELMQAMGKSPALATVDKAVEAMATALRVNKPLLVCGNGGSASDAMHITGELVGRFLKERRGLNAICLSANPAVLTAWSNDYSYETVFSRQVEAHGTQGGVLWGLSTSGNSPNVVKAFEQARQMGMATISLTGQGGGKLAAVSDFLIDVPSKHTPDIQQVHLVLYHYMCERLEAALL
jgi:D-sedoheptulose 7-phosphate isomerase